MVSHSQGQTVGHSTPVTANEGSATDLHARVAQAYDRAVDHLERRQLEHGAFAGEVVWNTMLISQYVIVAHVLDRPIAEIRKRRLVRSFAAQVRPDGGFAMSPGGESFLFHTTLAYVALRLLDVDDDDPLCRGALTWIRRHGGPYAMPTWGRIWLAMLGLYPWSGVQPIVPELWLLPESSPAHPSRLYCHMRLIYLGLSFVYGHAFVHPLDQRTAAIREALYPEGYDEAKFQHFRDELAPTDVFELPGRGLKLAFSALRRLDKLTPSRLRKRALATAYEHIMFEFRSTGYVCLSPVNGMLFCLALHITNPRHADLEAAVSGIEYWFWEDEDQGARICGARSDIWDTSFVIAALCEGPRSSRVDALLERAGSWLATAQIQEEIVGGAAHHRSPAYGGWGFANERHPWPVSDCTAEALEALLQLEHLHTEPSFSRLDLGRKLAAIEFVLQRQNDDGGFGSYEARRGPMVLQRFNPAEIYGNCMLEYSYTECTGSCVRGLARAYRHMGEALPLELRARIQRAVEHGRRFLLDAQRDDGAWLGFWGINVTYGTLFAVSGLISSGTSLGHPAIVRACRWLVQHQRSDGGWGESAEGMIRQQPIPLPESDTSLVVQTAWALLTLQQAAPQETDAIRRGIDFLLARQRSDGSWPPEAATGCFFNTAVLDYELYRDVFPTWALARWLHGQGS